MKSDCITSTSWRLFINIIIIQKPIHVTSVHSCLSDSDILWTAIKRGITVVYYIFPVHQSIPASLYILYTVHVLYLSTYAERSSILFSVTGSNSGHQRG